MSEMHTKLRRAAETDFDALLSLVSAYHDFEGIDSSEQRRRDALSFLLGEQAFGALWCIDYGPELAGYIALCRGYSIEFGGFDAFVDEFYLSPGYRGHGIGRAALQQVGAEARALGIRALHLEVARANHGARRLYRDAGFEAREKYVLMTLELAEQS